MKILFPSYPGTSRVDPAFAEEREAAEAEGFGVCHVDTELNLGGDVRLYGRMIDEPILYRGWLLKPEDYIRLSEAVTSEKGLLVTPPEDYQRACSFPDWYQVLTEAHTPRSIWFPKPEEGSFDLDKIVEEVGATFGGAGSLIKDYVKSRKQDWWDACFIPHSNDTDHVKKLVSKFLDIQGDSLHGGLVFREYLYNLKKVGVHPKTQMPLINEWRMFVLDGQGFYMATYWSEGASYDGMKNPDPKTIESLSKGLGRFVAIDMAETEDGQWVVIEVNNGDSAGIPEGGSHRGFYRALRELVTSSEFTS